MDNTVSLVIGDWSGDGHSQTETIEINTNLTKEDIQKAYKVGSKKIDVDTNKICNDYEDSTVDFSDWQKLNAAGLTLKDLCLDKYGLEEAKSNLDDDTGFSIYHKSFVHIYCFIVKQGNPEFEYKIVNSNPHTINIGGYGLFSS